MTLQDPSLLRDRAYIDGQWYSAPTQQTFAVYNPFDESHIASVPDLAASDAHLAIAAAARAFPAWSQRTAGERARLLHQWHALILAHQEDLALLLTTEQGKPLDEARGEITYGASFVEWFAEEARRTYGEVIPAHATDKRILTLRQAVGVVGAITPWNFPHAMITRKIAPALAAGCTVVLKPAEDTPLSALALAELAHRAGLPPGVLNVVTTQDSAAIGEVLTTHPSVRKISFTGSTAVGKLLMKQCASTVKRLSLELGGNAPFIVFDDADLEAAVAGAIAAKYRNAGQTCVCANRLLVQEGVYDSFLEKFKHATAQLSVGEGTATNVALGPLINDKAVDKVTRLVDDALSKGATLVSGSTEVGAHRLWPPTILSGATPDMDISREEVFGPVAPVYRFRTEAEAIDLANATAFGLAAYFYGRDYARIWRVAEALQYGMVGVNTGLISTAVAPFGGIKESGFGREGSRHGIQDYLDIKYVCVGGITP